MLNRGVSGLPVVDDDGKLVGILSEGDLLRRVELGSEAHHPGWLRFLRGPAREAAEYVRGRCLHVEDVMTRDPETVPPTATLEEVVGRMSRRHVRRLPVVTNGDLVGIVTRADLMRALALALDERKSVLQADADLEAAVRQAIQSERWVNNCSVSVHVNGGVAEISGVVFVDNIGPALKVAAERVPGVKNVQLNVDFLAPVPLGA